MHVDLDPGVTLVRQPSRATALHRLAIGHLHGRTRANDPAAAPPACFWIDAGNTASTHVLYDLAPTRRALAGVSIARAFTAYQHHALVDAVAERAGPETTLLVVPNVAALYGDDDLTGQESTDLLATALATLRGLARSLDVPVLVTATSRDRRGDGGSAATGAEDDDLATAVAAFADREVECTLTREGWRVEGPGVEQDGYWHRGYWQTTIPYWVDVLGVGRVDPVWERSDRIAAGQAVAGWDGSVPDAVDVPEVSV